MTERGTASMEAGQTLELAAAVIRQLPRDMDPDVAQGWIENQSALQRALRQALMPTLGEVATPSSVIAVRRTFARDMAKEGWTLESDVPVLDDEVISAMPEFIAFLKERENYINGDTLLIRAADLGCPWGQRHAETLLENQHLIPEEAKKYYLVFAGTVWRNRRGDRNVPYLSWNGDKWYLDFYWLEYGFFSDIHLLRSRK